MGSGGRRMGGKVQGIRSMIGRHKIDKGEVNHSIGNGEAIELTCMTPGHELKGNCWREGGYQMERGKGERLGPL